MLGEPHGRGSALCLGQGSDHTRKLDFRKPVCVSPAPSGSPDPAPSLKSWASFPLLPEPSPRTLQPRVHVLSLFSHAQLSATPWAVMCQAPLSTEFSR